MASKAASALGAATGRLDRSPSALAPLLPDAGRRPRLILDGSLPAHPPMPSPVHGLQDRLASTLEPSIRARPAPPATLLYIVVFTAGFWSLVAVGLRALVG